MHKLNSQIVLRCLARVWNCKSRVKNVRLQQNGKRGKSDMLLCAQVSALAFWQEYAGSLESEILNLQGKLSKVRRLRNRPFQLS